MSAHAQDLRRRFGAIDVYLFDQLLRGRFAGRRSLLEAGCGGGRNLVWFLRAGCDVHGIDDDPQAVEGVRALAEELVPGYPADRFAVGDAARLPHPDGCFDAVLAVALLHFARDEDHFHAMLDQLWRVLAPGGLFFARLASDIGIEERVRRTKGRWHRLPDGSDRFLVDEAMLLEATERLGGRLLDPLKTTNVQNLRCMTTWVLEKGDRS